MPHFAQPLSTASDKSIKRVNGQGIKSERKRGWRQSNYAIEKMMKKRRRGETSKERQAKKSLRELE